MNALRSFFGRLKRTFGQILSQGVSPRRLALAVAVGLVVGVFPILGTTAVLCTCLALGLRLNILAVHTVHYAVTPLQLLLVIPFARLGEWIAGAAEQPLSIDSGMRLIKSGFLNAVVELWSAIVHAMLGWLVVAPLALTLAFLLAERLLRLLPSRAPE